MENPRENGRVKKWSEKGFGFIDRSDGTSVFCHANQTPGRVGLTAGSMVSFIYEPDNKGGKAVQVQVEETVKESSAMREMGTVKRWNAEKGFGFIGRTSGGDDAFVHKKDCGGKELAVGQPVSFVFEQGAKGASAKAVREEREIAVEEDKGIRELGKVKQYNEDKGFAFIGRCAGGDDLFAHKKEFGTVVPYAGQPVSFLVEATEKGAAAKKIREEESVPDLPVSDEGRTFGTIRDFNTEKGYGFVIPRNEGDSARFFDKACKNLTPTKGLCVSFVLEETEKGPTAKDLREEDPERIARLTAKVHYGKVKQYFDPTDKKPTNGYGFIEPRDPPSYGAPKKYFFHMDEIVTPDEYGGINPNAHVSFIVVPAKKGIQAAAVTIVDPPEEKKEDEKKENVPIKAFEDPFAVADSLAELKVTNDSNGTGATTTAAPADADPFAADDDWGAAPSW